MNLCTPDLPEPVTFCHAAPFLAAIDEESTDIFFRLILFFLCADFISSDIIFFQTPLFCRSWNRLPVDDLEPCIAGRSIHLQPATSNQYKDDCIDCRTAVTSWPSAVAGFGRCGTMILHRESVGS